RTRGSSAETRVLFSFRCCPRSVPVVIECGLVAAHSTYGVSNRGQPELREAAWTRARAPLLHPRVVLARTHVRRWLVCRGTIRGAARGDSGWCIRGRNGLVVAGGVPLGHALPGGPGYPLHSIWRRRRTADGTLDRRSAGACIPSPARPADRAAPRHGSRGQAVGGLSRLRPGHRRCAVPGPIGRRHRTLDDPAPGADTGAAGAR